MLLHDDSLAEKDSPIGEKIGIVAFREFREFDVASNRLLEVEGKWGEGEVGEI
jgi:hypothetical protein